MLPCLIIFLGCLLSAPLHAGLLAHWKLDFSPEDQGERFPAYWSWSNPQYLTDVVAPSSTAAATFGDTWLNVGSGPDFERHQAFSATAWIRGGPQDSAIIGDMKADAGRQGWELHVGTTENGGRADSVTVWLNSDHPSNALQVNATANVLDDTWHHTAFTYDGSGTAAGLEIYIDGRPASATTGIDTLAGNISNGQQSMLSIGTRDNGGAHTFAGNIDEVALFDRALTAAEMNSVFLAGVESVADPVVVSTIPLAGQSVASVTPTEVAFSLPVTGVDASDLIVNGIPASSVRAVDAKTYHFTYPAPVQGDLVFTWSADHGIKGMFGAPAHPEKWLAFFSPDLPAGQVAIAEFLTRNVGGREDEDHDTPDWIELWNHGTETVNLAGWSLTDDPANPRAWVLPSIDLAPGKRRIVFASGKNRGSATGELHASFKLADEGGYLALSDPSGALIHVYDAYPKQEGNISFGLSSAKKPSDGRAAWKYMIPSPNAAPSTSPTAYYSGAVISDMESSPASPVAGDPITITIRTSPEAVLASAPSLFYKIMHNADRSVRFADDGMHGDGQAGDLVWGAVIPAEATAGQMVRWRVSLTGNSGVSRWPVNASIYTSSPLYEGTVIGSGTTEEALPVYQIFVPPNDRGYESTSGTRGAFYGNGTLHDHVLIRTKGTTSINLAKRSHRVDFNPGRAFQWSETGEPQSELNLNSEYVDPSYLRQNLQHWMHHDSGNAGAPHFPVRLLMNGAFWQLAFHTYSADGELLEVLGLDPRGALYKQVTNLGAAVGEQKTRRWDTSRSDLTAFTKGISKSNGSRTRYVYDNLNLPAVINYMAVARIAQESDDVWANMVVYRDTEGTGEWRPIPFDLNLSFGQLYYDNADNTTVHADHDNNKSHPLYGSSACPPFYFPIFNYLYDAVIQEPTTREMLLRRIRTLTDRYLTTAAATSPLEQRFDSLGALIQPDALMDRALWGLPPPSGPYALGTPNSPAQGLATLKSSFLAVRRTHFYVTHSINNIAKPIGIGNNDNAGIPSAQAAAPVISFGSVETLPSSGNPDQQYFQLANPGADAVDISDWTVRGNTGSFKMKGGTVIPSSGSLYVSPDVAAFRARAVSPKADESRLVVGPYSGRLSPYGETLRLEDATGRPVGQISIPADPNAPPASLAVTEIMSSSAHTSKDINGDWWEMTNTGGTAVNIAGFSWSDNGNPAVKIAFPPLNLAAGKSLIILNEDDEDEAALFRSAWGLTNEVRILTRKDFGLGDLHGLGSNDSVIIYQPDGTPIARADYTSHSAGRSRAWFRNGTATPAGLSVAGQHGAVASTQSPPDTGSPGSAATDPASTPYDIWSAANNLLASHALPTADRDNDGRPNREEYIFGGHPRQSDGPPPQTILSVTGGYEWTFVRRAGDPSLTFTLEASPDLIHWTTITPDPVGEIPHPTLTGYTSATYLVPRGADTKFLRARAD